ncbi:MAG: hypothetical protein ACRCSN_01790 [Dermatophilaceae bacterium]
MKVTVTIPDALAEEARGLARPQRCTLRDLLVSGLRSEIGRRRNATRASVGFPSVAGRGLVAGLEPADVIAASYGPPDTGRWSEAGR